MPTAGKNGNLIGGLLALVTGAVGVGWGIYLMSAFDSGRLTPRDTDMVLQKNLCLFGWGAIFLGGLLLVLGRDRAPSVLGYVVGPVCVLGAIAHFLLFVL